MLNLKERFLNNVRGDIFGGITAGIDFALTVVSEVVAPEAAQTIQLIFEYRPQPPFDAGSPESAPAPIVEMVKGLVNEKSSALQEYIRSKHAG